MARVDLTQFPSIEDAAFTRYATLAEYKALIDEVSAHLDRLSASSRRRIWDSFLESPPCAAGSWFRVTTDGTDHLTLLFKLSEGFLKVLVAFRAGEGEGLLKEASDIIGHGNSPEVACDSG